MLSGWPWYQIGHALVTETSYQVGMISWKGLKAWRILCCSSGLSLEQQLACLFLGSRLPATRSVSFFFLSFSQPVLSLGAHCVPFHVCPPHSEALPFRLVLMLCCSRLPDTNRCTNERGRVWHRRSCTLRRKIAGAMTGAAMAKT